MKHLNLFVALLMCVVDAALVCAFPLVGLMILPCLFGSVCWAAAALRDTGTAKLWQRFSRHEPLLTGASLHGQQRLAG